MPGKEDRRVKATYLLAHRRHIFTPYLPAFRFSNKEADGIVLTEDEDERVANTTVFDLGSLVVTFHILDDLSLRTICYTNRVRPGSK
jgi:hypothetical protein